MIANILFLCMLFVGWFLCLRIHRHEPQRETLFLVIFMTILVAGNILVMLMAAWPGVNNEQRGIIYALAALAGFSATAVLVGAWGVFSYLDRRRKNKS